MTYIHAIILGLVRGLGWTLPISESGHLIMARELFHIPEGVLYHPGADFIMQAAVLLAVAVVYRTTLLRMVQGVGAMLPALFRGTFRWRKANRYQMMAVYLVLSMLPILGVWFLSHAVGLKQGLVLTGIMLLVNAGLLFLGTHSLCKNWTVQDMKPGHAVKLGLFQGAALFLPGLSQTGITLNMGINMGFKKEEALEYSFMLSLPVMAGSLLLRAGKLGTLSSLSLGPAVAGGATALVMAFGGVLLLRHLVKKERFGILMLYSAAVGVAAIIVNFM